MSDEADIEREASDEEGDAVALSHAERREARRRTAVRAAVVFETVRREGEQELERPALTLAFSGLAAGLSMGFSLVATGVLYAALPDTPWRTLVVQLGYTLGFIIVVLGRQQLFTENTVTAIIPLLDSPSTAKFVRVVRLWGIVLVSNLVGAFIVALAMSHTAAFEPNVKAAFAMLSHDSMSHPFVTVIFKGLFAGWLIALMVWLLPAADNARLWVILIITYVVGAAGLNHIIAGSVEGFYGVVTGQLDFARYLVGFLLPVFIGNCAGGVLFVSLLNYGQVVAEPRPTTRAK